MGEMRHIYNINQLLFTNSLYIIKSRQLFTKTKHKMFIIELFVKCNFGRLYSLIPLKATSIICKSLLQARI